MQYGQCVFGQNRFVPFITNADRSWRCVARAMWSAARIRNI
jgi:hypothetical protein